MVFKFYKIVVVTLLKSDEDKIQRFPVLFTLLFIKFLIYLKCDYCYFCPCNKNTNSWCLAL